jgi:hypothetical protein
MGALNEPHPEGGDLHIQEIVAGPALIRIGVNISHCSPSIFSQWSAQQVHDGAGSGVKKEVHAVLPAPGAWQA